MYIKGSIGPVDLQIGRQPISFGNGFVFSPLDLVQPFSFATIDNEYKPGIDAVRMDGYIGMSTRITAVAAYAGNWGLDGMTYVLNGITTVGWTDISVFLGKVRSDNVLGLGVVSSIGPVGLHSDLSYTIPDNEEEDPFLRGVVGAMYKPFEKSTLCGIFTHWMQSYIPHYAHDLFPDGDMFGADVPCRGSQFRCPFCCGGRRLRAA